MRLGTSARIVGCAVCCFLALLSISVEQAAHAGDREGANRGIDLLVGDPPRLAGVTPPEEIQTPVTMPEDGRAAWIVDDFEDGNIDGWIDEGGGACSASTSAVAAFGAYSMRIDGACAHHLGRYLDIIGSRPTGVNVWVRSNTVDTHDTYFILGDYESGPAGNSGAIYFHGSASGAWSVFDGVSGLTCGPRNPDQWYQVSFVVDWACKMYDVRIDGVLKQSNVSFYHVATESFDRIHVYNWSSTTARYDQIGFSTPGVSPLIFEDDFERGSTCRWSAVVG